MYKIIKIIYYVEIHFIVDHFIKKSFVFFSVFKTKVNHVKMSRGRNYGKVN